MPNNSSPTTEISIPADNKMLAEILQHQYGRFEAGEARTALEAVYSPVWNEDEFVAHFAVEEYSSPYVTAVNKNTGQRGTAMYLDAPRFYFLFNPEVQDVRQ
jgi:hypothetical protein